MNEMLTITHYSVEATFKWDRVDSVLASSRDIRGRNFAKSLEAKEFYESCLVKGAYAGESEKSFFAKASKYGFVLTWTSHLPSSARDPYRWTVRIFSYSDGREGV